MTDPSGAQTTATHRAFGSPARPEVMQVIDALGAITTTTRDIYGNVTQRVPAMPTTGT
ncbi:MAG: hypothetical protein NDI84_10640 [Steroidobacteraceae bacterium]|nr:hypothetical protein [Steroidobacteraceae bacterium]